MYTLENTYNEIMNSPEADGVRMLMGKMMLSDKTMLDLVPQRYHNSTLRVIGEKVKTPWGLPYPADSIMNAANYSHEIFAEHRWEVRSLWNEGQEVVFDGTKNEVSLFTPVMESPDDLPAVIICPGGAYSTLAMTNEGFQTAEEYRKRGYRPYVLRYRLLPNRFPAQQLDLTLALLHVKSHAKEDRINPENVTIIGYSAGGHLCISTVSHLYEFKDQVLENLQNDAGKTAYQNIDPMPQKMVLSYTPHSLTNGKVPLTGPCAPEELDYYDGLNELPLNYPRTFAWACADDDLVEASSTTEIGQVLTDVGIANETRMYPTGGHGITLGEGTSAEGWFDTMMAFMGETE